MIAFTIYGKVTAENFDVTLNVDMNGGIISMNSISLQLMNLKPSTMKNIRKVTLRLMNLELSS